MACSKMHADPLAIMQAIGCVLLHLDTKEALAISHSTKDLRFTRFQLAKVLKLKIDVERLYSPGPSSGWEGICSDSDVEDMCRGPEPADDEEEEEEATPRITPQDPFQAAVERIEYATCQVKHPVFQITFAGDRWGSAPKSTHVERPAKALEGCSLQAKACLTHVVLSLLDLPQLVPCFLLHACPQLRHLDMSECRLTEPTQGLPAALAAATTSTEPHQHLRQLSLSPFRPTFKEPSEDAGYLTVFLQTQLAVLPKLQHVSLLCDTTSLLPSLAVLGTQLTRLQCSSSNSDRWDESSEYSRCHASGSLFSRLKVWSHSLSHIKQLELTGMGYIQEEDMSVLLSFPAVTHVTVDAFYFAHDSVEFSADKPCRWEQLRLTASLSCGLHVPSLAGIPLHSLKQPLQIHVAPDSSLRLLFHTPYGRGIPPWMRREEMRPSVEETIVQVQKAISNVVRCRGISWAGVEEVYHRDVDFGPSNMPVALAADMPLLQGADVRQLFIEFGDITPELIAALGTTLGGTLEVLIVDAVDFLNPGSLGIYQALPRLKRFEVVFNHNGDRDSAATNATRIREVGAALGSHPVRPIQALVRVCAETRKRTVAHAWRDALMFAVREHDPKGLVTVTVRWSACDIF